MSSGIFKAIFLNFPLIAIYFNNSLDQPKMMSLLVNFLVVSETVGQGSTLFYDTSKFVNVNHL